MHEKFGAIWVDFENDDNGAVVFEFYDEREERLYLVYRRQDNLLMPFVYAKKLNPQFSRPFWVVGTSKVLFDSVDDVSKYLHGYGLTQGIRIEDGR